MTEDRQLHVFSNEVTEYIVAYDEQDAGKVWEETTGENLADYIKSEGEGMEFTRCPDDGRLAIKCEDVLKDDHKPAGAEVIESGDDWETLRATMRAWADVTGRGYLCSTEY